MAHYADIDDVAEFDLLEIQHFFEVYKALEPGKAVEGFTGSAGPRPRRRSRTAAAGWPPPPRRRPGDPGHIQARGLRDTDDSRRARRQPVAHAEDVLSRAPLFETLDDEGARALRAGVVDVQLARGDRLFDEGDDGDRLYVILDGKIKLTRTAPDGRENLLSVLGPGRDVRRAFALRPAAADGQRGGRHRLPSWPGWATTTCGTG